MTAVFISIHVSVFFIVKASNGSNCQLKSVGLIILYVDVQRSSLSSNLLQLRNVFYCSRVIFGRVFLCENLELL